MSVGVGFGVNLGGVGFLLDVVGRVTSQVNSERPFFLVRTGPVRGLVRTKTAMLERVPAPRIW